MMARVRATLRAMEDGWAGDIAAVILLSIGTYAGVLVAGVLS